MKNSTEIRAAILANNPINVTIKENGKSLVVSAPNYSSHSSIFDKAFRLADSLNIKWGGKGHLSGEVYTLIFKETKNTKAL